MYVICFYKHTLFHAKKVKTTTTPGTKTFPKPYPIGRICSKPSWRKDMQ